MSGFGRCFGRHRSTCTPRLLIVAGALMAGAFTPLAAQSVAPDYLTGLRWRSIGPYRSGYIAAVAGVPGDPTTYYAATPEGGVWKTSSAGTVWEPVFDEMHVPSVGAIAVAPSSPSVVYAGTGDASGWSFTAGKGVYKSTDAGKSWKNIGLEDTRYIDAIIVDPRNADLVLVGSFGAALSGGRANTARGVYRTSDGGTTWTKVLYVDAYSGVKAMTFDATNPSIIYASFQRSTNGVTRAEIDRLASLGSGLFKSSDEGATWTALPGTGLPPGQSGFEIAVASGTHGQRVYVESRGAGRDAGGIYRSDDGGATWSLGTKEIGSAGGSIYVDPKNPDVVYLMGTSVYRSVDGAHTFASFKGGPGGDDERHMWIDPENPARMIIGADQGPTISVDSGKTWTPWFNLPNGQFYNVSIDGDFPYRVCGSQQDSGTACVLTQSDYGRIRENDWYAVGGFERGAIVTDPVNPRWIWTQGWYHVLRRYDRTTGQVAVLYTPTAKDRFGGLPPLAFSPQHPHLMYMAAQYLMASTDGARTWSHISPDLTAGGEVTKTDRSSLTFRRYDAFIQTISVSGVSNGQIWAGTNNGLIQLTRDGGKSWSNVTPPGLPVRGGVAAIDASHSNAAVAYAAVNAAGDSHPYIYRTSDFGKHWTKIVDGLPDDGLVRVVREDPVSPDLLYAGTVNGAWVSFDKGDHWQSLQLNLPTTVVSDIVIHKNDVAISTYGRGFWVMDDVTPLRHARAAVAAAPAAHLYPPELTYRVRWDNDQDTPRPPEVPAGENAPEGAIIYYNLANATTGAITLSIHDSNGNLVREYTNVAPPPALMPNVPMYWFAPPEGLPTTAGLHRVLWDLRYPDPKMLPYGYYGGLLTYTEYTLTWHAVKGHTPRVQPPGPMAIPGRYEISLTVDGHTYKQPLTLVNDPRVDVPASGLAAQLKNEQRMTAGMNASYLAFIQIDSMRTVIAENATHIANGSSTAGLPGSLRALDKQLTTLADSSFGIANRDLTRQLEDADFGDLTPTANNLSTTELSCRDLGTAFSEFNRLLAGPIPELNATLRSAGLKPLPLPQSQRNSGCDGTGAVAQR